MIGQPRPDVPFAEIEEPMGEMKPFLCREDITPVYEMTDPAVVGDIAPLINPTQYGSTDWMCSICKNCSDVTRLRCWYCSSLRPEMRPAYTPRGILYKRKDDDSAVYI
jgi:hypothetical protein